MKKDHRPYFFKQMYIKLQKIYTLHFLKPQFHFLGDRFTFLSPWNVKIFGGPISIGDYATVIASSDKKIYLSVWSKNSNLGSISIGKFSIICPGVRISSACSIDIADNCMIASNVYITDCDWHGIYDRLSFGKIGIVKLKENVWIGDGAIICKGVTVGRNSIVGAGSVVVDSVPSNVIVAGNPAKIVKKLDPNAKYVTRKDFFSNPSKLVEDFKKWDFEQLKNNTVVGWLKNIFFPKIND